MAKPYGAKRNLQLDLLRFVAIVLVFCRHSLLWDDPSRPAVLRLLLRGGWAGVDLFFVLSGFLVGGLLFIEFKRYGTLQLRRFYVRRALKLYPAFYLAMAVVALMYLIANLRIPRRGMLGEVTFLQNYVGSIVGYTWSLAVEEHFYIALPLLFVMLMRRSSIAADLKNPFTPILWIYPAAAVLTIALRSWMVRTQPYRAATHLAPTHLRFDSLMCGVALAFVYHFRSTLFEKIATSTRWILLIIGLAIFVLPMFIELDTSPWMYTLGLTALSLGSACLITCAISVNVGSAMPVRAMASLGAFSYSIYLFHGIVFWLVHFYAKQMRVDCNFHYGIVTAIQWSLALVVGVTVGTLVEFPALKVRDRLYPSRTGGPVQADGQHASAQQSTESPNASTPLP